LKRRPAETPGGPQPTPFAVVAGAFRRAWVRVVGLGERRTPQRLAEYSGHLDSLLAQHDLRHGRPVDGSQRVFKAPGLVNPAPAPKQAAAGRRSAKSNETDAAGTGRGGG
jgi:hypothetical protein